MTHGAGSMGGFSGGGGGGYSGGAYFMGSHHHRHSKDGEECCACCCLGLFSLLSYALCLRRMSWYTRVLLLWLYVLVIVLTVGLVLGLAKFGTTSLQAAPTDMRALSQGVSTLMCDKVSLTSVEPFTAYLLDAPPRVDPDQRQVYGCEHSMYIYQGDYEYWGFYLLPGSSVRVESSAFTDVTLFVIQGQHDLRRWLRNAHCSDCYFRRMRVPGGFTPVNFSMTATEADDVYFVYAATYRSNFADDVTATFHVNRTLYDVTGAQATCSWNFGEPCLFTFDLNSRQTVVFHSTNSSGADSTDMRIECEARASMYAVLLGVVPLCVGALLSLATFLLCRPPHPASAYQGLQ